MIKQAPLVAPDVTRMDTIERELAAMAPRLRELASAMDVAHGVRETAMRRAYDLDGKPAVEARLMAEFKTADRDWRAAYEAWRAAERPAHALRTEWLQLQVVRSFLPRCEMCDETVGAVYLQLGRADHPAALCFGCFDNWFCDHDPASDRKPPSHWLQLTAQEARDLESRRRQQGPPEAPQGRPCWHCAGAVDDLGDLEHLYIPRHGYEPACVVVKVAALVPEGTQPEIGEVCLLCLDRDLELDERWAEIEKTLVDRACLRHERALYRWVRDGPLREPPEAGRGWSAPASAPPQPATAVQHRSSNARRVL